MPECHVDVRWPDGSVQSVYSPSLVLEELFTPGTAYPVADFLSLARSGLHEASRRVQARYGHPCSLAAASLASVERRADDQGPAELVQVLAVRK